jgi:hypothetical protein
MATDTDEYYCALPLLELNDLAKRHLISNTNAMGRW